VLRKIGYYLAKIVGQQQDASIKIITAPFAPAVQSANFCFRLTHIHRTAKRTIRGPSKHGKKRPVARFNFASWLSLPANIITYRKAARLANVSGASWPPEIMPFVIVKLTCEPFRFLPRRKCCTSQIYFPPRSGGDVNVRRRNWKQTEQNCRKWEFADMRYSLFLLAVFCCRIELLRNELLLRATSGLYYFATHLEQQEEIILTATNKFARAKWSVLLAKSSLRITFPSAAESLTSRFIISAAAGNSLRRLISKKSNHGRNAVLKRLILPNISSVNNIRGQLEKETYWPWKSINLTRELTKKIWMLTSEVVAIQKMKFT